MMARRRLLEFALALVAQSGWAQEAPRVHRIVNAASQAAPAAKEEGFAVQTLISIYGENLATSQLAAEGFPLPKELAGTRVWIGEKAAPLQFVSPGQINAVVPNLWPFFGREVDLVVETKTGRSDPAPLLLTMTSMGIFTVDGSGCGQGLVYQTAPDASVSLNGSDQSADPGVTKVTVLATGGGIVIPYDKEPPDGEPFPPPGLPSLGLGDPFLMGVPFFTLNADRLSPFLYDKRRSPGLVGVYQLTFRLPENVPESCAVALRLVGDRYTSQNVTIAVRRGGGPCVNPPVQSVGVVSWERTVTKSADRTSTTTNVLRVEFLANRGKELPKWVPIGDDTWDESWVELIGPSCPEPQDMQLDAGRIEASGPGWGPLEARFDSSSGYTIQLPEGAIHAGSYTVKGSGGADVGPFESTTTIPEPIQPRDYPPGTKIPCCVHWGGYPTLRWSGGDEQSWVRVSIRSRPRTAVRQPWLYEKDAPAPRGFLFFPVGQFHGLAPAKEADLIFTQWPETPVKFEAKGLTQGGVHQWRYRWRLEGMEVLGQGE